MKVKITNKSTRTILVCGVYLAPKKSIVVDWDTLSDVAKASINSLADLGIIKMIIIGFLTEEPQDIEQDEQVEIVEENETPKSNKRTKKSK